MDYTFQEVAAPEIGRWDSFRKVHEQRREGDICLTTTIGIFRDEELNGYFFVQANPKPKLVYQVLPRWVGKWSAEEKARSIVEFFHWINPGGAYEMNFGIIYLPDTDYPAFAEVVAEVNLKWSFKSEDDRVMHVRPSAGYGAKWFFSNWEAIAERGADAEPPFSLWSWVWRRLRSAPSSE